MSAHLFKTEPSTYSFDDLVREKRAVWDGISNPVALSHLRAVRKGDTIAIYHTGSEKAVVGLAVAASDPYPDPKLSDPKRVVVDLKPDRTLPKPVPLATFRSDTTLETVAIVRMPRLSVAPLSPAQLRRLLEIAGA